MITSRVGKTGSVICKAWANAAGEVAVEEVRSEQALWLLEREWNDLLARSENNLLFLTHEWLACWWRHFGQPLRLEGRAELFVLALRRKDRLRGLAPLYLRTERVGRMSIRFVRFLGEGLSDYSDFILAEDRDTLLRCIVDHLRARSAAWDMIDLREFYGGSSNLPLFRAHCVRAGLVAYAEPDSVCRWIPIRGDWESFYRSRFDRRRRKDHRREWRNLQVAGRVDTRFVTSLADEPGLIDTMAEIQSQHPNAGPDRPGELNVDTHRRFFEEWLPRAGSLGWLALALLECDGHAIAYFLLFRHNGRHYVYITSYRREFQRFGVGKLLMMRMLEHCWASGGSEIDLLRGDETFKENWTTATRQNVRLSVTQRSLQSRFRTWMFLCILPALEHRAPRVHTALSIAARDGWATAVKRGWKRLRRTVLSNSE